MRVAFAGLAVLCMAFAAAADEAPATALETITVIGQAEADARIVGSAHLVDQQTLEAFAYDDLNRVLAFVPGVYLREEDGFGLRPNIGLRGANSDRSQKVTLLEDGVLFGPAPYSAPAAYYSPLTARMVGVEVFKGPAAIQHGPQTIGGAVNLISAPVPGVLSGLVAVDGGTDGYGRAHLRGGGPLGSFGALGEFVHVGSDGFKALDGGGDTGFEKNEAMVKLGHDLGEGRIELRLGYADEVSDETYLGLTEADFRAEPLRRYAASALDRMDWEWYGVRLDLEQPLLGGRLLATAYSHDFSRAWMKFNNLRGEDIREVLAAPETPRNQIYYQTLTGQRDGNPNESSDDLLIGTNDRDFRSSGVQGRLRWNLGAGEWSHGIEAGARLHDDRIRRLHDEFAYDMLGGRPVRNAAAGAITADNTARATALAAWLRDEIVRGRWTIAPGLRIESIDTSFDDRLAGLRNDDRYSVVLPGIGVNFAQTATLSWFGGVHKGFSPGSPGSGEVEPEEAVNYEAGLVWNGVAGRIELTGFYSDYSNLTAQCTFSAGCDDAELDQQTNAGEVRVQGVEAGWRDAFAVGQLSLPLSVTYTWTDGEFRESFESPNPQFEVVERGDELPYVPEHRANAVVGLEHPRWDTQLSVTYVSAMRDTAGSGPIPAGEGSDGFTVVDLAAGWALSDTLRLVGRIDNLLDREYVVARRPFGARPGKPLSAQLGVRYRF
ncbi:MAG: TonB-dependent receptor family protein [Sinimarinibacterium flocculans]|uniref:TonB-dependent receptor family protein n=1 Tax=Sinimarinibacterium flocculans TaxID=985250 RepID=UPI003C63FD22